MTGVLRRLHRDDRGQILPLFMMGILSLVLLVAMILNTGHQVGERTRVQNSADAVAMTEATWIARSLNIIAMNNAAVTQAFSTAVLASGLAQMAPDEETYQRYMRVANQAWIVAQELALMSESVVKGFPGLSQGIAGGLVGRNQTDQPIMYAGYDHPRHFVGIRKKKTFRYLSIPLPVQEARIGSGHICTTGRSGTPRYPSRDANTNFEGYGYPRDWGPFSWDQEQLASGMGLLQRLQYLDITNSLWDQACRSRSLAQAGTPLVLYQPSNQPALTGRLGPAQRNSWSVIAFTRLSGGQPPVLPAQFTGPPGAKYGLAQAEVYNEMNYDLYSQFWRARLVPARLMSSSHLGTIRDAVRGSPPGNPGYPVLYRFLSQLNQGDLETFLAH